MRPALPVLRQESLGQGKLLEIRLVTRHILYMTPAQFAVAAGANSKWLINSRALLGRRARYTAAEAFWWGLVRILNQAFEVPLHPAATAATRALAHGKDATWVNVQRDVSASASIIVNLARYRAVFLANLSRALLMETPKRRGRPRPRSLNPIRDAAEYGLDIGLIRSAMRKTPAERLELLEANLAFLKSIKGAAG